jgi:hypothetical protein
MLTSRWVEVVSRAEYSALMFARSASVSTAAVTNRSMCNPVWINTVLSNSDSATHEYCRGGFSNRGIDEPSLGWYPPVASSP